MWIVWRGLAWVVELRYGVFFASRRMIGDGVGTIGKAKSKKQKAKAKGKKQKQIPTG
jgi:hypothetical protein